MDSASNKPATGPNLLRMALSATKAMAGFAGSGFQDRSPVETQLPGDSKHARSASTTRVCRCKICGCFTNVKSPIAP